jgi:16S rRNA processing protein RimM
MHKLILVGKIARPHGFRGELIVQAEGGSESALGYLREVFIGSESSEELTPHHIQEAAWMPKGWKIRLAGWSSDSQVIQHRGESVFADRSQLKETDENEYYIADLEGARVIDVETKELLGELFGVESSPGADRWWIKRENETFAIPAIQRYVHSVDKNNHTVWVKNVRDFLL